MHLCLVSILSSDENLKSLQSSSNMSCHTILNITISIYFSAFYSLDHVSILLEILDSCPLDIHCIPRAHQRLCIIIFPR